MPLFILTGELMNRAGITRALIDFSMSLLGRFKGGLGHVNIVTSVFFAGISGAATADAAALSNTLVPAMRERGYDAAYAAAITAASATIGPIIPPSIILIVYGAIMETSVAALFIAGILPGLLLAAVLMLLNGFLAHRHDHPGGAGEKLPKISHAFVRALPALSLPVIILGGIVFGVTTPTEAAAIAVLAAWLAARAYDGLSWAEVQAALLQTAKLTGAIFMILSAVACFGYLAGLMQWPLAIGEMVQAAGLEGIGYLLLLNVILLLAGMVLELPVALTLLVPYIGAGRPGTGPRSGPSRHRHLFQPLYRPRLTAARRLSGHRDQLLAPGPGHSAVSAGPDPGPRHPCAVARPDPLPASVGRPDDGRRAMKVVEFIARLSDRLDAICRPAAGAALLVMIAAIALQVVARYVFQEPPSWTEEAARYAMVWTGMLGATIAFKAGFDPALVTFARGLSGPAGLVMALLRGAAVLLFLVPVLYFSLFSITGDPLRGFLGRAAGRSMESLGLPMIVVAIAVPFAALVILVHLAAAGLSRRGGDGQP